MSYIGFIIKNPFRNKARSSLAIVGIALGVATIVALGMVMGGLLTATQSTLKSGSAEILVTPPGSTDASSTFSDTYLGSIQNVNGVKDAVGVLKTGTNVNGSSIVGSIGSLSAYGIDNSKLNLIGIDSVNGTMYSNESSNEIIMGKVAAQNLNKTVGNTINLYGTEFTVTGIYESGNIMQDNALIMPLGTLQNLTNNQGRISEVAIKVTDNANVSSVSQNVQNLYPNQISTTTALAQANRINQGLGFMNTAANAIALLAIIIGAVGVINTMVMSVRERTREIGVLKAVGWRNTRILTMILGESIALTLIAAVIGTLIGVAVVELLLNVIFASGSSIHPILSLSTFLTAFGIAFLVGIIGGLYPAYRASRLPPTEALRYE